MHVPNVFIAILRQPDKHCPQEKRSDPFWEFGSFGCTGCKKHSLLHPKNAENLGKGRIAFAQGGASGWRLVLLTPPVSVVRHRNLIEVRWDRRAKPFRYAAAPVLIDKDGHTDFETVRKLIRDTKRATPVSQFASRFRGRGRPLPPNKANTFLSEYRGISRPDSAFARTYIETLPYPPPRVDTNRLQTYQQLLSKANGKGRCKAAAPTPRSGCPNFERSLPQ